MKKVTVNLDNQSEKLAENLQASPCCKGRWRIYATEGINAD